MTVSFFFPPSHSEMLFSLPWEQECKTSALVTNKHLEATERKTVKMEKKCEQELNLSVLLQNEGFGYKNISQMCCE